jgi:hypothetical protein
MATAIPAAISAYSMAVAPVSSARKARSVFMHDKGTTNIKPDIIRLEKDGGNTCYFVAPPFDGV